ncbi:MAG: AmmeMemoRadiSam system protein A [Caldicoprobacterales bacterium]|jgi:AmmeMemoRadiSam system protein A/AmmeMemoRadiSam system protein B
MGRISAYYALPHPPIILPEVGRGEEAAIQETINAFYKVSREIADIRPDTIIIVTPHGPMFQDTVAIVKNDEIQGDMSQFRAPGVKFRTKIDMDLTDRIIQLAEEQNIAAAEITKSSARRYGVSFELDHGTMVPMYFVNKEFNEYQLVHITYGLLSKIQLYKFGICIQKAVEECKRNVVFIASGDLSHRLIHDGPYSYSPYGEKFDNEIKRLLEEGDVEGILSMDSVMIREAGECALRSYYILLGAMDGYDFKGQTLSYQGNFGVGYLVMSFHIEKNEEKSTKGQGNKAGSLIDRIIRKKENEFQNKNIKKNPNVRLAGDSLMYYLVHGRNMKYIPSYVTDDMRNEKRGVFVSLKKNGNLRGCIGTIVPTTDSLAREIMRNAVEAGIYDPRFQPITLKELNELEISVDILTEPEPAELSQLDPKKYGVIVRKGNQTGLLLPDLEGVDTVEAQLNIALQKAGIPPDSSYSIERFQVIRYEDEKP